MLRCLTYLSICLLVGIPGAAASDRLPGSDPHALYETKCAPCHEAHAGDFVPDHLDFKGDIVVYRSSGNAVETFLGTGHGKLGEQEVKILMDHLSAILQSGQIFRKKCLICHDTAVKLARSELILKDDDLYGRYSASKVSEFLHNHGRLDADEVDMMVDVLSRQLETIPQR